MRFSISALRKTEGRILLSWGNAKLIRTRGGKYELVGGSKSDLTSAREWISMFLLDEVIRER